MVILLKTNKQKHTMNPTKIGHNNWHGGSIELKI